MEKVNSSKTHCPECDRLRTKYHSKLSTESAKVPNKSITMMSKKSSGRYSRYRCPKVQAKASNKARNQSERSKVRKMKQRQSKQAELEADTINVTVSSIMSTATATTVTPCMTTSTENSAPEVTSQTSQTCQPMRRTKTHFRKSKKPGRA